MEKEENAQAIEGEIDIDDTEEEIANPDGEDQDGKEKAPVMSDSIEIVQEGGESQPQTSKTKMISDRINQVNERRDKANDRANAAEARADKLQAENDVFRAGEKISEKPPSPDDFELGQNDPEFVKKRNEFEDQRFDRRMDQRFNLANRVEDQKTRQTERKDRQSEHYERSQKLRARDYNETEDKAIEYLGMDAVQDIIASFPKSEMMIYFLGKNKAKADHYKGLIDRGDTVKAIFELGGLSEKLSIKPKTTDAPDPDEPLVGAQTSSKGSRGPKGATFE